MKKLKNEQGVALITALMYTLIIMAIIMVAFYLLTQGVQVSAANKRYKNSMEAAHGGVEVFTKSVIGPMFANYSAIRLQTDFNSIGLLVDPVNPGCLAQKLKNPTASWGGVCGARGTAKDAFSKDPTVAPDATFQLKGMPLTPGFIVYSKVVDTQVGNSNDGDTLEGASGAAYAPAYGTNPKHIPTLLTIEVQGQSASNPKEKSKLSVLYAH